MFRVIRVKCLRKLNCQGTHYFEYTAKRQSSQIQNFISRARTFSDRKKNIINNFIEHHC